MYGGVFTAATRHLLSNSQAKGTETIAFPYARVREVDSVPLACKADLL